MKLIGLTREEIKDALKRGFKVRHRFFGSQEWVKRVGIYIHTEEGYSIDQNTFWGDRAGAGFDTDWSIVEEEWMYSNGQLSKEMVKKILYLGNKVSHLHFAINEEFWLKDGMIHSKNQEPMLESDFWRSQNNKALIDNWYVTEKFDGTKCAEQGVLIAKKCLDNNQKMDIVNRDLKTKSVPVFPNQSEEAEKFQKIFNDAPFKLFCQVWGEKLKFDPDYLAFIDDTEESIQAFKRIEQRKMLIKCLRGTSSLGEKPNITILPPNDEMEANRIILPKAVAKLMDHSMYGTDPKDHQDHRTISFTEAVKRYGNINHSRPHANALEDRGNSEDESIDLNYNTEPPFMVYSLNFLIEIAIDPSLINTMTGTSIDDTYDGFKPIFIYAENKNQVDSAKKSLQWFKDNHRDVWNELKAKFISLHTSPVVEKSMTNIEKAVQSTITATQNAMLAKAERLTRDCCDFSINVASDIYRSFSINDHSVVTGRFASDKAEGSAFYTELGTMVDAEKIEKAMKLACGWHATKNDLYGTVSYRIHLQLAFYFGCQFLHLLNPMSSASDSLASIWTHDMIENLGSHCYTRLKQCVGIEVAEISFALTPLRGRNRSERYNDVYLNGISNIDEAVFAKHCDRLANIFYSHINNSSNMLDMYRGEQERYEWKLMSSRYKEMSDLMEYLLK